MDTALMPAAGETEAEDEKTVADVPEALLSKEELDRRQREKTGDAILTEVANTIRRFMVLKHPVYADVMALWIAHAMIYQSFDMTPRLGISSKGPGSGKTQLMRVLKAFFGDEAIMASNTTAPAVFLAIEARGPEIMFFFDEADIIFNNGTHVELRGILNAGAYSDGAVMRGRGVSKGEDPVRTVFAPVCFAGLGRLPVTLEDRSILIRLEKANGKPHDTYRPRLHRGIVGGRGIALKAWARSVSGDAAACFPEPMEGVSDRMWEKIEPLLIMAQMAGEEWEKRAREAFAFLLGSGGDMTLIAPGQILLRDIREIFRNRNNPKFISREDLAEILLENPEWADRWESLNAEKELTLALRDYGVPDNVGRVGQTTKRGFKRENLEHAWEDLPPEDPETT